MTSSLQLFNRFAEIWSEVRDCSWYCYMKLDKMIEKSGKTAHKHLSSRSYPIEEFHKFNFNFFPSTVLAILMIENIRGKIKENSSWELMCNQFTLLETTEKLFYSLCGNLDKKYLKSFSLFHFYFWIVQMSVHLKFKIPHK